MVHVKSYRRQQVLNEDKSRIENEDALFLEVGRMFARNQRQKVEPVEPEKAKRKLDSFVRALAESRTAEDLSVEEVWILGEQGTRGCAQDRLPLDVAETLGFKPGATYGELVGASLMESNTKGATPRMGDIVKVVNPEDGLEGMTGEVVEIKGNGLFGVELPGWGGGHTLECLHEPDGWYFSDNELEVLSEE
jgi:hypothetical protein